MPLLHPNIIHLARPLPQRIFPVITLRLTAPQLPLPLYQQQKLPRALRALPRQLKLLQRTETRTQVPLHFFLIVALVMRDVLEDEEQCCRTDDADCRDGHVAEVVAEFV